MAASPKAANLLEFSGYFAEICCLEVAPTETPLWPPKIRYFTMVLLKETWW